MMDEMWLKQRIKIKTCTFHKVHMSDTEQKGTWNGHSVIQGWFLIQTAWENLLESQLKLASFPLFPQDSDSLGLGDRWDLVICPFNEYSRWLGSCCLTDLVTGPPVPTLGGLPSSLHAATELIIWEWKLTLSFTLRFTSNSIHLTVHNYPLGGFSKLVTYCSSLSPCLPPFSAIQLCLHPRTTKHIPAPVLGTCLFFLPGLSSRRSS